VNEEALDLLKKMLMFNPSKRISFKEALKHKYFDSLYDHPDFTPSQKSKKEILFDSSFETDLEDIKSKF
jgi:serine/threonine protein kinase